VRKIGKLISFFIIGFISVLTVRADESVQVISKVNSSRIVIGQPLIVTLQIISTGNVSIEDPELPNLSAFDLVGSWTSQSTSSRLVQGARGMEFQTKRSYEYHYQLIPQTSGGITIGAFRVRVDGKLYETKPLKIEVTLNPSQVGPPSPSQNPYEDQDELERLFNQMLQRHQPSAPRPHVIPRNLNDSFFIHIDVDKTEAYVGEQITVNWYLYTKGQILGLDRLKFPDLKGFWKEIIEEVPALNFTPEVINGVMYRKALLASHALFPIKGGVSVIDEYKVRATVQLPIQSFGGFAYSEPYSYQRSSDRIEIKVKEIPKSNQPKNFSGAVGQFEVTAQVTDTQVPVNQPFAIKIRFEGEGNAKLIDLPEVAWPEGLEYFNQTSEARFFKNGRSFREFEVLVIPRKNGEIEIPAFTFSFFDPKEHRFYEKSTQPILVQVVGDAKAFVVEDETANPATLEETKLELPKLGTLTSGDSFSSSPSYASVFRLISFFIFVLGLLSLILLIYFEFIKINRKRTWKEYFDSRLRLIELQRKKAGISDLATLMTQTLCKLIGAVSQEGISSHEFSKLLEQSPPSLQAQIGSTLLRFYESLELLAYAPSEQHKSKVTLQQAMTEFKELGDQILNYLES